MEKRGLILVNTGSGKGKTTAALGTALRAFGNQQKVLIMQFIKGAWKYGELSAIEQLGDGIVIKQLGDGFVRYKQSDGDNAEKFAQHQAKARLAWQAVVDEVMSDEWDLVVLDEVNYAIDFGLVDENEMLELLDKKPLRLNMILTGRNAREKIIEKADTVTEMKVIKHALEKGIRARKGIEF